MAFFSAMNAHNRTTTQNGAPCYDSTKDERLNAFTKLVRCLSDVEIEKLSPHGLCVRVRAREGFRMNGS